MSSIRQLVSEIAHSVKQPDSIPVRRAIRLGIIHARNTLIRQSFENHGYVDKGLQQRFKVSLTDVPDGDLYGTASLGLNTIKRTANKVPRPTRLTHNLPFQSVRTIGVKNTYEIPFVKEASSRFYSSLPGLCPQMSYDYINDYIYINILNGSSFSNLKAIVIESPFEYPHLIPIESNENEPHKGSLESDSVDDDNEFFLPEDMIGDLKKLVLETFALNQNTVIRDTNEVASQSEIL